LVRTTTASIIDVLVRITSYSVDGFMFVTSGVEMGPFLKIFLKDVAYEIRINIKYYNDELLIRVTFILDCR
jgi:hypothetical protein